jgi:hypothetical protein
MDKRKTEKVNNRIIVRPLSKKIFPAIERWWGFFV